MNIKKLFSKGSIGKRTVAEFLNGKGFYFVLILCVVIIGVTAVLITRYNFTSDSGIDESLLKPDKVSQKVEDDVEDDLETSVDTSTGVFNPDDEGESRVSSISTDEQDAQDAVNSPEGSDKDAEETSAGTGPQASDTGTAEATPDFMLPVSGSIIMEHATDKLVYSKTLEEWRTHPGIDIATRIGTAVKAADDGVVLEVTNDPCYGTTIMIDHENGFKTIYCNLQENVEVVPNQKVKKGDCIGWVGNTAIFESVEQAHLHFEVWKNDKTIDPVLYISSGD